MNSDPSEHSLGFYFTHAESDLAAVPRSRKAYPSLPACKQEKFHRKLEI